MTCVHSRLDGALCPHCMSVPAPTSLGACYECSQLTGGRCWRHVVQTFQVGELVAVPALAAQPSVIVPTFTPNQRTVTFAAPRIDTPGCAAAAANLGFEPWGAP